MGAHSTLGDMHNILMSEMERLNEVDLDDLDSEVSRAQAMSGVAKAVVDNAKTMMSAIELQSMTQAHVPRELSSGHDE